MAVEPFRFDLTTAPWIPVRTLDGRARELGLQDTLVRAHEITGLNVEFPTQEPPLLRLLLAFCYRAFEGPIHDDAWDRLWATPTLPKAAITAYLERWRYRLDLFDPEAPFFQSPQLEPAGKGGIKPAARLISHAPPANSVPLFTPMTDEMGLALSPAEATLWLIERHAWGTTSDKAGAKGNPRVKKGRDTPQVGHVAWIGFTAPIGKSLRETLLLNLIPWSRTNLLRSTPDDLPAWERAPTGPAPDSRPPDGVCDLYTWQGRRILLFPERRRKAEVVTSVLVCAGDDVQRDAVRSIDPHTGWRSQKKKDGSLTYSPLTARTGQQVWRGLGSLLASSEDRQRAGVLSWLAALEDRGIDQVSLLVTATTFGNMSSTIEDLLSDSLDTPVVVLRSEDISAYTVASDAVVLADAAAKALCHVADGPFLKWDPEKRCYIVPEGKKEPAHKARDVIREDLFACLDAPFRQFLSELSREQNLADSRSRWVTVVQKQALLIARRHISQWATAEVFTGAEAEGRFRRDLAKGSEIFCPSDDQGEKE